MDFFTRGGNGGNRIVRGIPCGQQLRAAAVARGSGQSPEAGDNTTTSGLACATTSKQRRQLRLHTAGQRQFSRAVRPVSQADALPHYGEVPYSCVNNQPVSYTHLTLPTKA